MAITELSLPIDIPQKQVGVSGDMIDDRAGDLEFSENSIVINIGPQPS